MQLNGYNFVLTCLACPEQYDVYSQSGGRIAYVRLRHGVLTADIGGCSMSTHFRIFEHEFTEDPFKGCFLDNTEREEYLGRIVDAIEERCKKDNCWWVSEATVLFEDAHGRRLIRYYWWKTPVSIDEIQATYEDIRLEVSKPVPGSPGLLFTRIVKTLERFSDRIVYWEEVDFDEVS